MGEHLIFTYIVALHPCHSVDGSAWWPACFEHVEVLASPFQLHILNYQINGRKKKHKHQHLIEQYLS